ncbi:conserved hypothetical protein [Aromatoleum aromaticum EbN1]|uniref:Uncharacterized protein n=1 Tax=Aromatoleum aromaticum (strain DSM 19018 / LMG 30748 / EbN1) TaxID=76114 RepID=Q5P8S0_AROAE|nr:Tm-1-like ATP-binding domain-containing protein [Aromatoleum aromaticum]CAI06289.1 conserved hypothetical protein [Aromatoleum aromaticum EbN1]
MADKPKVLLVATRDTKNEESQYIRQCLEDAGVEVYHLDASIRSTLDGDVAIGPDKIAGAAGMTMPEIRALRHEGLCLEVMIRGALKCADELNRNVGLSGILGLGGSMGTVLATRIMQTFPYGLPKVMISTMASGMTGPFVGAKDIMMVNPVCDISGLNSITRNAFRSGALAVAAMAHDYQSGEAGGNKPLITVSTLGTTEKCSARVRRSLEQQGFEVMVFHTLGTGGAAMEQIIRERDVAVVIDMSLIEVSEYLHGGLCATGPDRGKAALEKGVPTIFAPGNLDFLVAGPLAEAKVRFPGRRYHEHNPALTAVRAEAQEFRNDAEHLAGLIRTARGPVSFFVPLQGFSNHDSPDGHLHDPSLPPVFLAHLKTVMPAGVPVVELPLHINDEKFADALVEQAVAFSKYRSEAASK